MPWAESSEAASSAELRAAASSAEPLEVAQLGASRAEPRAALRAEPRVEQEYSAPEPAPQLDSLE